MGGAVPKRVSGLQKAWVTQAAQRGFSFQCVRVSAVQMASGGKAFAQIDSSCKRNCTNALSCLSCLAAEQGERQSQPLWSMAAGSLWPDQRHLHVRAGLQGLLVATWHGQGPTMQGLSCGCTASA